MGVRFEKVRKVYAPGQEATVKDVDLTIDDGTFFILLGPSGCGKSTMLRMIAGLETVTAGSIRIGEREVNDVPPKDRDIAMVFQSYALYPHLTVGQNMGFGLKMRGESKAEIARRIAEIAPALGLEDLLDRLPKALSGGQRQRVALGRAIVREPKVFLLDEPLSNLDAKLRGSMRVELKRLHRRLKTTMVYVTHDQVEAMTLGDQVAVLNDGVIQQVGPPMEVYEKPVNRFVAGFLGSPPMNFLPARATASGLDFGEGVSIAWPGHLRDAVAPGVEVEAGVRPEHVGVVSGDDGDGEHGPRGVVAVTEPLGAETIVTVDVETANGPVAIVARLNEGAVPRAGESVRLLLDPAALHLFDTASGDRIGAAP